MGRGHRTVLGIGIALAGACSDVAKQAAAPDVRMPELAGQRRCLSLRALQAHVTERRRRGQPPDDEAVTLGGIGQLEAFAFDPGHHDVVLVGRHVPGGAVLHLDDLVLALQLMTSGVDPICSLDPTAAGIQAAQRVLSASVDLGDDHALQALVQRVEQALGPQTVLVRGVPAASRWAVTLIDADYVLKQLGQQKLRIPGIRSQLALAMEGSHTHRESTRFSRFWFRLAADDPQFLVAGEVVGLARCRVQVLTEAQHVTATGLADSGGHHVDADTWAEMVSTRMELLCAAAPACARLQILFRLLATVRGLAARGGPPAVGLDLTDLVRGYSLQDPQQLPPSLPALANAAARRDAGGDRTVVVSSILCGGVEMRMSVRPSQLRAADPDSARRLLVAHDEARPPERIWWRGSDAR